MLCPNLIILSFIASILTPQASALWSCSLDSDCGAMSGSVCVDGDCVCTPGTQPVFGNTLCAPLAPYHTSECVDTHQCSRMSTAFECRREEDDAATGSCVCQPGHHYFLGRCWSTVDFGEPCSTNEECLSAIRDPFSLVCDGVCQCAPGYYLRQRGECRKIGYAVGDGCVIDEDCQFEGGRCDHAGRPFTCVSNDNVTEPGELQELPATEPLTNGTKMAARSDTRVHGTPCGPGCDVPFECSTFGVCLCPIGYYPGEDGSMCYAELGSPSTEEQCAGLLAEVRAGVCTCPANFFFETNMRDCVRVTRQTTESCVTDENCHTFGAAAVCGEPTEPWQLRSCQCNANLTVWDAGRQMCRLFARIGESCESDSDCMAGNMEIQCVGDAGAGHCACPPGYAEVGELCLTTGLELGDACQATAECTATEHTVCEGGQCACDPTGYRAVNGSCAPIIGGACESHSDCVIEHTECAYATGVDGTTCQCRLGFVEFEDECWPSVSGILAPCNITVQCQQVLGESSWCVDGTICSCLPGYHHRDGGCWPQTGLFESCSRSSQCFISGGWSERAVCRNSLCQCEFHYPYSERLRTCTSSATTTVASIMLVIFTLLLT